MNFCLPRPLAQAFKKHIISGEINPDELSMMLPQERHAFFARLLGEEHAGPVNALFESKLLLKNQQAGMINWAKKLTGISDRQKKDIIDKVYNMKQILTPENEAEFMEDLVEHKLKTHISFDESDKIVKLAQKAEDAKLKMNDDFTFPTYEDRMTYGRAKVDFGDYVSDLKNQAKKPTLKDFKNNPLGSAFKGVSWVGGLAKSMKATLDNSVIGRQGLKTAITHPKIWLKNSAQTFKDMYDTFGGKNVMREIEADVQSRPNALNGLYKKEGLALGNVEEAYPTSLPSKIPLLGRIFKASENAFTGFQYRTRADVFDRLVQIADVSGADIKGIGRLVNSLTGRGHLGVFEQGANHLNNLFFSPRFFKSNLDTLLGHAFDYGHMGTFAKKQAAGNLGKMILGVGGVLGIAYALDPDSVEFDSRSSDFGKIKVGATRFDVAGGMSQVVTLATRLLRQSTKSSSSGNIRPLDTGKFGEPTSWDAVGDFFENKLSPIAGVLQDLREGKDFDGNKPTLGSSVDNLLTPLPIKTFTESKEHEDAANRLLIMILEGLGIGSNTY